MERITLSVAKRVVFKAFLTGTNTPATGKTIAVVISKNGGSFGNPNAGSTNATGIANGWYYVDLDTTDTGTAGPLVVRGTEGSIDPAEIIFSVEAALATAADLATVDTVADTIAAVTAKLDTALEADGGVYRYTTNALENGPSGGGGGSSDWTTGEKEQIRNRLGIDGDASAPSATPTLASAATLATVAGYVDTEIAALVSAVSTVSGKIDTVDDFLDTEIAAIKAKTDNLPSDPADHSLVIAATTAIYDRLGAPSIGATIAEDIAATAAAASADTVLSADTIDAIAEQVLDLVNGIETGLTLREALRLIAAAVAGKVSGAASSTVLVRNAKADSKTRMTVTTDVSGNRTGIVYDLS